MVIKNQLFRELARKKWRHPGTGRWTQFAVPTIERWYYRALREPRDPVGVLARKVREDRGTHPSMSAELRAAIHVQYKQHPDWSYQLHADNLAVWAEQHPQCGSMPSYPTVLRRLGDLLRAPVHGGFAGGLVAVHVDGA